MELASSNLFQRPIVICKSEGKVIVAELPKKKGIRNVLG